MRCSRFVLVGWLVLVLTAGTTGSGCDKIKGLMGKGGEEARASGDDNSDSDGDEQGSGSGSGSGASAGSGSGSGSKLAGLLGGGGKGRPAEAAAGGTLREVVEGYQSYEKCSNSVQGSLPPDLGKDLLGHINIPDGLCRAREAMKRDDPSACKRVTSYALRKGCLTMYAMYRKKPNECYMGYPKRRGRDGYCLALATRNTSLCRSARTQDQEVTCKAILGRDGDLCGDLTKHSKRQECKAEVRRWHSEMGTAESSLTGRFEPKMELLLKLTGATRPLEFEKVVSDCADAGAVVPSSDDGVAQVNLCEYYTGIYRLHRGPNTNYRMRRIKIMLSFKAPTKLSDQVSFGSDAKFSIRLANYQEYKKDPVGTVKFSRFERKRGGRITGSFSATVSSHGRAKLTVEGKFDTFVRDLVDPALMKGRSRYKLRPPTGGRPPNSGLLGILGRGRPRPKGSLGLGRLGTRRHKRFAALLSAATFTRTTVGGEAGMKMTNILHNSIWIRLGLKNGDVLLAVGAETIKSKSSVVRVRGQLRKASSLLIKINRGGSKTSLTSSSATLERIRAEFAL